MFQIIFPSNTHFFPPSSDLWIQHIQGYAHVKPGKGVKHGPSIAQDWHTRGRFAAAHGLCYFVTIDAEARNLGKFHHDLTATEPWE